MRLSVVIITRNESVNIGDCLRCLTFADECIIIDQASEDDTANIARLLGASVHVVNDWPGFGPQKNRALALATGDWILSIDADERVTPELCQEIQLILNAPNSRDSYLIPRLSSYCGQFILHSGWSPDYVLRLFRRDLGRFSDDLVHEKVLCNGSKGKLTSPLIHLSFPNFESVLDKVNRYSTAGALSMSASGYSASLIGAVFHGLWAFFRTYILRCGFLDGQFGLALAISNAEGTYYRYAKRWLMALKEK